MTGKYWIKLYHEILDDPKMMRMPPTTFAICIKLFLLAGKEGDRGYLPCVEDIAWHLRLPEDEITAALDDLAKVNILVQDEDGGWFVRQFDARNEAMDPAEKMRRYRKTQHSAEYHAEPLPPRYDSVTKSNIESEADTEADQESEAATAPEGNVTAAVAAAVAIGFAPDFALQLVEQYGAWKVQGHIDSLGSKKGIRDKPAFVRSELEKGHSPPLQRPDNGRRRFIEGQYADCIKH